MGTVGTPKPKQPKPAQPGTPGPAQAGKPNAQGQPNAPNQPGSPNVAQPTQPKGPSQPQRQTQKVAQPGQPKTPTLVPGQAATPKAGSPPKTPGQPISPKSATSTQAKAPGQPAAPAATHPTQPDVPGQKPTKTRVESDAGKTLSPQQRLDLYMGIGKAGRSDTQRGNQAYFFNSEKDYNAAWQERDNATRMQAKQSHLTEPNPNSTTESPAERMQRGLDTIEKAGPAGLAAAVVNAAAGGDINQNVAAMEAAQGLDGMLNAAAKVSKPMNLPKPTTNSRPGLIGAPPKRGPRR